MVMASLKDFNRQRSYRNSIRRSTQLWKCFSIYVIKLEK